MIKLTPAQEATAKSWITDLFVLARMYTNPRSVDYKYMQNSPAAVYDKRYKNAAINIYKEITGRHFNDINSDINTLSELKFGESLSSLKGIRKSPEQLAKYLAWFMQKNNVLWNDTIYMPEETEAFKKTYLGKALEEAGQFASQSPDKIKVPSIDVGGKSLSGGSRSAGDAPKSDYKSSGPQSKNARDLKSEVGKKEYLSSDVAYAIIGKSATAVAPYFAYIRPLDNKYSVGTTNKVLFGRDSGYTYCACWFNTRKDAEDFLARCESIIPADITEVSIGDAKVDRNGYFLIGTEFGDCYIKASKLNEAIIKENCCAEAYDIDALIEQNYPETNIITDIKKYAESINYIDD